MHHSDGASHRSGNRHWCLRGTRRDVLQQLEDWLENEQGQRVFWLNSLAGTRNLTIAQTFAEGKLSTNFFCSRDLEDRSNVRMIFQTPFSEHVTSDFFKPASQVNKQHWTLLQPTPSHAALTSLQLTNLWKSPLPQQNPTPLLLKRRGDSRIRSLRARMCLRLELFIEMLRLEHGQSKLPSSLQPQ